MARIHRWLVMVAGAAAVGIWTVGMAEVQSPDEAIPGFAPDLGCYELGSPVPRYGPRQKVGRERR